MISPVKIFALTALVLLLAVFFKSKLLPASLDLQIHATYFVLSPTTVCLAMAAFLCIFAASYSISSMNARVTAWHVWLTTFGVVAFWISFGLLGHMFAQRITSQMVTPWAMLAFGLSALVLLASPVVFAVNLLLAVFRGNRLA